MLKSSIFSDFFMCKMKTIHMEGLSVSLYQVDNSLQNILYILLFVVGKHNKLLVNAVRNIIHAALKVLHIFHKFAD